MTIKGKKSGFTLIEILLVNALIVVVVGATMMFWNSLLKSSDFSMTQFRLTEEADTAVRRLTTELRELTQGMQGAYPLEIANDFELAFYTDTNGDNAIDRVHYRISSGNLIRGVIYPEGNPPQYNPAEEKTGVIASNLITNQPLFYYYNGNWPQDTSSNPLLLTQRYLNTRFIKVSISIQLQDTGGPTTHTAESTVQLRNLKDQI